MKAEVLHGILWEYCKTTGTDFDEIIINLGLTKSSYYRRKRGGFSGNDISLMLKLGYITKDQLAAIF